MRFYTQRVFWRTEGAFYETKENAKKHFPKGRYLALAMAAAVLFASQSSTLEAAKSVSQLEDEKDELQDEIDALDSQLVNLLTEVDELEAQISQKQQEISDTQAELEAAEEAVQQQYEDMKVRIQYMYENDDRGALEILLESGSISDFLNRLEYVNSVYDYDRELLESYEATQTEIGEMKKGLESDMESLQSQQSQLADKQASLNQMIADKQDEMEDFDAQLAEAKALAARQAQLEEERRQAQLAAQEAQNSSSSSSGGSSGSNANTGSSSSGNVNGNLNPGHSTNVSGSAVVSYANTFVGNPYKWGGNDPNTGADCSGFVQYVFAHFGITWGGRMTSVSFRSVGKEVSYNNMQPGDIVCYSGHVAIYAGGGRIVEAQSTAAGITNNRPVDSKTIITIRRVL